MICLQFISVSFFLSLFFFFAMVAQIEQPVALKGKRGVEPSCTLRSMHIFVLPQAVAIINEGRGKLTMVTTVEAVGMLSEPVVQ